MEPNELAGKVSLVTGASRGVGRAVAIKLGTQGSKVAINYLASDEKASDVAEEIKRQGGGNRCRCNWLTTNQNGKPYQ